MPPLTEQQRIRAVELHGGGTSQRAIAAELQCSQAAVGQLLRRWTATGSIRDRPRGGRPRALGARDRRRLVRFFTTEQIDNAAQGAQMAAAHGLPAVSVRTVQRELHAAGLRAYTKQKKPRLTAAHRAARLQWAEQHQHFTAEDWQRVIFSDEALVFRVGGGAREWTWCYPAAHLPARRVTETLKFGGGSIMVWAAISYHGLHNVVGIPGNLDGPGYLAILEEHLTPILTDYFPDGNAVFQQDNAPCHTTHDVLEWLAEQHCGRMEWPPQSPDLNPIENFWVELKKAVRALGEVATKEQLWENIMTATRNMWEPPGTAKIRKLIDSMPARVQAVLAARGGYTRY
jgi:transposase